MEYITLKSPKSVNTIAVKKEVKRLIKAGKKTNEIALQMEFVATDAVVKYVVDKFRVLKNKIALEVRG